MGFGFGRFLKEFFGPAGTGGTEALKLEVTALKKENAALKARVVELEKKVSYSPLLRFPFLFLLKPWRFFFFFCSWASRSELIYVYLLSSVCAEGRIGSRKKEKKEEEKT